LELCADYLVHQKLDDFPIDPVARFHLSNGASLRQVNWLADTSERALAESAGIMVSYLYDPAMIEQNHSLYLKKGTIACSKHVRRLANLNSPAVV